MHVFASFLYTEVFLFSFFICLTPFRLIWDGVKLIISLRKELSHVFDGYTVHHNIMWGKWWRNEVPNLSFENVYNIFIVLFMSSCLLIIPILIEINQLHLRKILHSQKFNLVFSLNNRTLKSLWLFFVILSSDRKDNLRFLFVGSDENVIYLL